MSELLPTDGHTPGPWRVDACGGYSTVICPSAPVRNDTRIPPYAYRDANGHCIGYPFQDDDAATRLIRLDFVCFSHADARLIAAAPELLAACKAALGAFEHVNAINWDDLRRAIAKAEGRSNG